MAIDFVFFILCAGLVVLSGSRLAFHGDRIAELSGLGRVWVGLILMAAVTSLPELVTGISSVAFVGQPDLAAGDVFGSCVFNLLILSIIDARVRQPITSLVKPGHVVAGFYGIILLAVAGVAIVLAPNIGSIGWVSPFSLLIAAVYALAIWSVFHYEKRKQSAEAQQEGRPVEQQKELRKSLRIYAMNAVVVMGAAFFLPHFGDGIAKGVGLEASFFGTLFLAATTSLPELVVSISALRLRSYDMLVGNLLGSNIFNILILALDDVFYTQGSLFSAISPLHLVSILAVAAMTAVAGLGIFIKPQKKFWRMGADTVVISLIYLALVAVLYFVH